MYFIASNYLGAINCIAIRKDGEKAWLEYVRRELGRRRLFRTK